MCLQVKSQFDSAGVDIIAVGPGKPSFIKALSEMVGLPAENIYVDSNRQLYKALNLIQGLKSPGKKNEDSKHFTCALCCTSVRMWCCYGFQVWSTCSDFTASCVFFCANVQCASVI